jgi:hypothetical protein
MSGAVPLPPTFAVIAWTEETFFCFTYTRVGSHSALIRNVHIRTCTHIHSHHHHHHHTSVMELGHLLTRSGLTYPEVSSKVCHDSFCQLGKSVSLPWVICYEAFYLHVVHSLLIIND